MPFKDPDKQVVSKKKWDELHPENRRARVRKWASKHRKELAAKQKQYYSDNPSKYLLLVAKQRARKNNIELTMEESDIVIPAQCPFLLKPLFRGTLADHDWSPTIDRIDSTKGYVKGNIHVISHRANRIKTDATFEELEQIVNCLRELRNQRENQSDPPSNQKEEN